MGLAQVVAGACHGYLAKPAARNVQHLSDYCPQCLNGPGMCGDLPGQPRHEAFGKYASPPDVAETYEAGGMLRARVVITANHRGRWGLKLCALPDTSPRTERAAMPGCLKRLKRTGGKGSYVYLWPSASVSTAAFRLPRGVTCERCVLQWLWETGNSCTPPGTPAKYANGALQTCGSASAPPGETFTNCADIRIV